MCNRPVMYERRVQILLDNPRYLRVAAEAKRRGGSLASVVRDAIDQALPGDEDRGPDAARVPLHAGQTPVPDDEAVG